MHRIPLIILSLLASFTALSAVPGHVRFHDEAQDTARITEMLADVQTRRLRSAGDCAAEFGKMFIGTPYVAHTLEGEPEMLTVNLDELDCTTFAETVMALALTISEGRSSWRDFTYHLERLRYRQGEINGYPSRLHYICDWAVDNSFMGNLKDATPQMPHCIYKVKTIDFMSRHADRYPALADSTNLARIKAVEDGYRNCRFPYVKTIDLGKKETVAAMRNGDILAFVGKVDGLDVNHMGILIIDGDGTPRVLHASSTEGKVVLTDCSLADFVKRNRAFEGVRFFRLP